MTGPWENQAQRMGHEITNIRKDLKTHRYIVGFVLKDEDPMEMYMSMDLVHNMDDAYKLLIASLK